MFSLGIYEKILLVSKKPFKYDKSIYSQYYSTHQLEEKFEDQIPYVKTLNDLKEFHTYRLINIKDSE